MSKQEKKSETADDKKEKAKPGAGKTVLIVEDTTELAEVIQATLERLGITAYHETHAGKALDIFKKEKPDLILLDIGLPDMSGWKLLDGIKELDKDNMPHFIVITAYGDPANRLMGKLQEVDSYLIKPFSPDEVERVVGKVLGFAKED
jgi:DNA-binding response OmpR family regulator